MIALQLPRISVDAVKNSCVGGVEGIPALGWHAARKKAYYNIARERKNNAVVNFGFCIGYIYYS